MVHRGQCADQLTEIFTTIFNIFLPICTVPKCFKSAINVPIHLCESLDLQMNQGLHYPLLALSTGVPQIRVLSFLLYTLYTSYCTPICDSNINIIKFTVRTTIVGLIHNNDKSAYRDEVEKSTAQCLKNKATGDRLQKEVEGTCPSLHQRGLCGEGL